MPQKKMFNFVRFIEVCDFYSASHSPFTWIIKLKRRITIQNIRLPNQWVKMKQWQQIQFKKHLLTNKCHFFFMSCLLNCDISVLISNVRCSQCSRNVKIALLNISSKTISFRFGFSFLSIWFCVLAVFSISSFLNIVPDLGNVNNLNSLLSDWIDNDTKITTFSNIWWQTF